MSEITLGILGGGQLGSMLSIAAKKLSIKSIVFSDDQEAPAQNFCDEFIFAKYDDKNKIYEFSNKVDYITFEFENIPYETLNELNKLKTVLPKPSVNRLIQHRLAEKDFVNKLNIRTTRYTYIEKKSDSEINLFVEPNIESHSVYKLTDYKEAIRKADIIVFLVGWEKGDGVGSSP